MDTREDKKMEPASPGASRGSAKEPTAEMWAKSHLRGLLGRLEDEYHAYESAEGGSRVEAMAHDAWREAQKEINEIFIGLFGALRLGVDAINGSLQPHVSITLQEIESIRDAMDAALAKAEGR